MFNREAFLNAFDGASAWRRNKQTSQAAFWSPPSVILLFRG